MFFPLHDQNNSTVRIMPVVSYGIILICFLVQIYQIILVVGDSSKHDTLAAHFVARHGLIPSVFFSGNTVFQIGPQKFHLSEKQMEKLRNSEEGSDNFNEYLHREVQTSSIWIWLSPVTYIFLHGGWMHILGNMWFFWIFSDNVEERFGNVFFALFFLGTGIFSGLTHAVLQSDSTIPLVGASGAVSAVMGAYVAFFPKNRVTSYFCPVWFFIRRIDVPAVVVLGLYLITNLISISSSATQARVAFDAHIAGFISGFAIAWLMQRVKKQA